jgi:hypothetical protein
LTTLTTEGNFINYAEVAQIIEETMHREKFELIETALEILGSHPQTPFFCDQTLSHTSQTRYSFKLHRRRSKKFHFLKKIEKKFKIF